MSNVHASVAGRDAAVGAAVPVVVLGGRERGGAGATTSVWRRTALDQGQNRVVILVDLEPGDERLERDALPVLVELRTHLTPALFAAVYDEAYSQGLRYLAAYESDRCVGVAGWRVVATTAGIRKLYVDDLVTSAVERNHGVGAALLAELEERARAAGCQVLDLDSGTQRSDAHRFYMRERFEITGFHFARPVR